MSGLTLARINEITVRINSNQDLHSLLTVIMDTAREFLQSDAASLLLYDAKEDELYFDVARGSHGNLLASRRIAIGEGVAGLCAEQRQPIVVNDAASDVRINRSFDQENQFETRNLLAVPMMADAQMIGVLEVLNTQDGRDFENRDIKLLSYLSNMAALAIRNRQLYEDVRERMNELRCIHDISQDAAGATTIDHLMDIVLRSIERVLQVERLSIMYRGTDDSLALALTRGFTVDDHDQRIDPNEGIAGMVMRTGDPLLVQDVERDLKMDVSVSDRYNTKSFISVPLVRDGRVVGILNVADKLDRKPFDYFELNVLTTLAQQLSDAITRIEAREREAEIQNYRRDLETAAMIQKNSLPMIPSHVAGLEIATRYEACKDVGGDFYDLIYHSEDRVSLVIADVAGKGVPAALFMEYSKTLIAGQIPRNLDPVTTFARVNTELFENSRSGIFVTAMLLQIEREHTRLRIASAGHNHQLLVKTGASHIDSLSAPGKPLGIFAEADYQERLVDYTPGDLLVLYTDGITEAVNENYDEFGEERLLEIVNEFGRSRPQEIIDAVFAEMERFSRGMDQADDSTMMVVRL